MATILMVSFTILMVTWLLHRPWFDLGARWAAVTPEPRPEAPSRWVLRWCPRPKTSTNRRGSRQRAQGSRAQGSHDTVGRRGTGWVNPHGERVANFMGNFSLFLRVVPWQIWWFFDDCVLRCLIYSLWLITSHELTSNQYISHEFSIAMNPPMK